MPMSDYLERIREKVGHELLMLPSAAVAIHDDNAAQHSRWMDTAAELLFQSAGPTYFKRAAWRPAE